MHVTELEPSTLVAILRLLARAQATVFAQDDELRYKWIKNAPFYWNTTDIAGKLEVEVLPAKAAALATAVKREVLNTGHAQWSDLAIESQHGTRYYDLFVAPEHGATGQIVGVVGLAIDITDRRSHAETMESIAREQAHRTKNLLAVIQGLGTQTARSAASTDDFINAFRGRIQSISRSQDLSIGVKRRGARLSHLIETQVHPYVGDIGRQLEFTGEDRYLSATGALHVGLAFYELCIAATQTGSLSVPDGKVTVSATILDDPQRTGRTCLKVVWRETDGPVGEPIDGFAKVLLQRIVPAAVGGRAELSEIDSGRSYILTIADTEFE